MTTLPVPRAPGAVPAPAQPAGVPAARGGGRLGARERDFLLLTVFVLAQQGYTDRAGLFAEALYSLGDYAPEVLLARAVLRFLAGEWGPTLACLEELDRLDPVERFGAYRLTEPQRMRRFMAARCQYELGDAERSRDSVEIYLRHGPAREADDP